MAGALGSLNVLLGLNTAQFTSALTKSEYESQMFARRFTRNMQSVDDSAARAAKAISGIQTNIRAVAGLAVGAFSLREITGLADTWTGVGNQLRYATDSHESFARAQREVLEIADETRGTIDGVAAVYAKVAENQELMNIKGRDVGRVTDTISKSLVLFARTSQEAASAQLQLGQALGSGRLQGDEYKSLRESASGLVTQLAKALNVTRAQLDEMATNGELTSELLGQAFLTMSDSVDNSFNAMKKTISQGGTVFANEFLKIVGGADDVIDASDNIADAMIFVAKNLGTIATVAGVAAAGYGAFRAATILANLELGKTGAAALVASTGFIRTQMATIALTGAMGGARSVAIGLGAALRGFALTPMGLALIAASTAFAVLTSSQRENKESLDALSLSLDDYVEKVADMSKVQQQAAQIGLAAQIEKQKQELSGAFSGFSFGSRNASVGEQFRAIAEDTSLSADEMSDAFTALIEKSTASGNALARQKDKMVEMAASAVDGRKRLQDLESRQKAIKDAMDGSTGAAGRNSAALRENAKAAADALKEYDKLIKGLREQAATFGMNDSELARYKASILGVSDAQVEVAALQGRQVELLEQLKTAAQEGNSASLEAARREYRANQDRIGQLERMTKLEKARAEMAKYSQDLTEKGAAQYLAAQSQVQALSGSGGATGTNARANETLMLQTLVDAGVENRKTLSILMGQLSHESAGFTRLLESASGQAYEGRSDLGNTHAGDGSLFKGRGFVQLTGRYNYEKFGKLIGRDLVGNPDLAAVPEIATQIAVAYLRNSGAMAKAEAGDIVGVTRSINGGTTGLQDRQNRTAYYSGGALDSLMAEQNAIARGQEERRKKMTDFELVAVKRVAEQRQQAAQNEIRMLELSEKKNDAYYAKRESLIQKETAARVAGIDAEIEILKRKNDDVNNEKVLDLEAEKLKLLADQKVQLAEIKKEHADIGVAASKAMQEAQASAKLYIDTLKLNDQRSLDAFGLGDRAKSLVERQNAEADRFAENMRDLQTKKGTLSEADYQALARSYRTMYEAALIQADWFYEQESLKRQDWTNGFTSALANYTDSANNMAENVSTVFGTFTTGLEDAWVNFVTTGKLSFSDMAKSVIADIARIQARAAISGLFNLVAGAFTGYATVGGAAGQPNYGGAYGFGNIGFAGGGFTGAGGKYDPAGIVHRGEGVLNQDEMRKLGGEYGFYGLRRAIARGYANGGVVGGASQRVLPFDKGSSGISIVNQTTGRVDRAREARLPDGEKVLLLEEFLNRAAESLADPNSKLGSGLHRHYQLEMVR